MCVLAPVCVFKRERYIYNYTHYIYIERERERERKEKRKRDACTQQSVNLSINVLLN